MSSLVERLRIATLDKSEDKRVRLTPEDKEDIRQMRREGQSIRGMARLYGVSKRLIQFTVSPERLEHNYQLRLERGGSKIYYQREKHTSAMRRHRQHKREVYERIAGNDPGQSKESSGTD